MFDCTNISSLTSKLSEYEAIISQKDRAHSELACALQQLAEEKLSIVNEKEEIVEALHQNEASLLEGGQINRALNQRVKLSKERRIDVNILQVEELGQRINAI